MTEIFKIAMPRRTFVFVSVQTSERFNHLQIALGGIGASVIGAQAFTLGPDVTAEAVRDVLGPLEEGECIYLVSSTQGVLESHLLVPPRIEGGVIVR